MKTVIINKIFSLPRPAKRIIQVTSDSVIIVFCFWLAMALRLDGIFTQIQPQSWMTLVAVMPVTIVTFAWLGLYRAVVRYMADRAVTVILIGAAVSSAVMFVTSQYFVLEVPRSVSGIYFSLLVLTTGGKRLAMRSLYLAARDFDRAPVAIYGAGEAGRLLMRSLQESKNYRPALFIDDNTRLLGTTMSGIPILSLEMAKKKISEDDVKTALIAIGDDDPKGRRQAALSMTDLGLEARMMPKMSDLISGRVRVSALRSVKIEELLGREPVEPDQTLMNRTTRERSVMITGAGGSIGSELCRQILRQHPRRLVILDVSEYALYTITEELIAATKTREYDVELVPVLGSVTRQDVIESAIKENAVETLFHAAAYKHVPLVEQNAIEAVRNNTLGTHLTAQAAGRLGVQHFALISTDKAVRPTNIMGATKRLAELAVLEAANAHPGTKFCSVRFGNVLGSSGSVVPKFERQIQRGGPITLTHPDITRYFMTIPEAAQLVIQASTMAERGDVFLLDMGEPVRILDLARTMCALHARHLHTDEAKKAPEGAIMLEITGLRPGEKLYEELLVTGLEANTSHPKIKCEQSAGTKITDVGAVIDSLLEQRSNAAIANALATLPLEYQMDGAHQALASES
ncbi:polysaccharide biosynthesis protein [Rhodobacterales bacterium HKCCA1065]|nr:polysaccharide biosynthesis protein [Rhodobacterales bacterium HKCCA1065]